MKRSIKQLLALVGVITLGISSVTACGGSGSSETKVAVAKKTEAKETEAAEAAEAAADSTLGLRPLAKRETLSAGFFAGSAHSMSWYVADKMGFFDELSIDAEYQSFTGGPAVMEASAGQDVCDIGGPGVLNGMKNYDMNMIGICDNEFNTGLFVRPDTDLAKDTTSPEVWRGKEVLLNGGTTLQYMFMQCVASIGIEDLEAYDTEIIDIAIGTCLTAFRTGEGDALCVWSAFTVAAELGGSVRVTNIGRMNLNNISGIYATSDAIENKTDLISTAYQVYCKTWEWCEAGKENMAKAKELFMESYDDEGVAVTEETVVRLIAEFQCTTLDEAVAAMTREEADRNDKGGNVSPAAGQLSETLDFFITLGNYTEEGHQAILDKRLVNPAITNATK